MIRDKKYYRKPRRTFKKSIAEPNQSIQLRTIIDRLANGLPVQTKMREHIPLPPDGELLDDFDSGTEEFTDITDVIAMQEELQAKFDEQAKDRESKQNTMVDVTSAISAPTSVPANAVDNTAAFAP